MNNIIQWNCRGLRANFTDFDYYVTNIIQLLTKIDCVIRGFNSIHLTSCDIGGRACGGVSVLARDSECTLNTTLQAKTVTIYIRLNYYCLFIIFAS